MGLQCHPDKLPPDTSQSERDTATKEFHRISQAYKVLSDDKEKTSYDASLDGKLGGRREHSYPPPPTTFYSGEHYPEMASF